MVVFCEKVHSNRQLTQHAMSKFSQVLYILSSKVNIAIHNKIKFIIFKSHYFILCLFYFSYLLGIAQGNDDRIQHADVVST